MSTSASGPPPADLAPDGELRRADAFVFVDDLDHPSCNEDVAHHLFDVLRLTKGASVAVSDGQGRARLCSLVDAKAASDAFSGERRGRQRNRSLELGEPGPVLSPFRPEPRLTLGFALQKGDRAEWTVQKLTEIGIDTIIPLITSRTIVRLDAEAGARRGERLRRVAREAACQARQVFLPAVVDPLPLEVLLDRLGEGEGDVAFAEPGGAALSTSTTTVLVGPEGGWSNEELAQARRRVGLGSTILRAETAAIVAASLLAAARRR